MQQIARYGVPPGRIPAMGGDFALCWGSQFGEKGGKRRPRGMGCCTTELVQNPSTVSFRDPLFLVPEYSKIPGPVLLVAHT